MPIIQINKYLSRVKKPTTMKSKLQHKLKKQTAQQANVTTFSTTGDQLKPVISADGSTKLEISFPRQGF